MLPLSGLIGMGVLLVPTIIYPRDPLIAWVFAVLIIFGTTCCGAIEAGSEPFSRILALCPMPVDAGRPVTIAALMDVRRVPTARRPSRSTPRVISTQLRKHALGTAKILATSVAEWSSCVLADPATVSGLVQAPSPHPAWSQASALRLRA